MDSINQTYLESCRYHPLEHPFCPVFGIQDIVSLAGENFAETAIKVFSCTGCGLPFRKMVQTFEVLREGVPQPPVNLAMRR